MNAPARLDEDKLRRAMMKLAAKELAAQRRYRIGDDMPIEVPNPRKGRLGLIERARPLFLEGMNSTEVAAALGCGRGSAVRVLRALRDEYERGAAE